MTPNSDPRQVLNTPFKLNSRRIKLVLRCGTLGLLSALSSFSQNQDLSQTVSVVNPLGQVTNVPAALVQAANAGVPLTNDYVQPQIRTDSGGTVADYGLLKLRFTQNIAESRPVSISSRHGNAISFRPACIALVKRSTGECWLLAQVTNSVLEVAPSEVVYRQAYDAISADLRYGYSANGSRLEQFVTLREKIVLPKELQQCEDDLDLECWTEFFLESDPVTVQQTTVMLREAQPGLSAVQATDYSMDVGGLRIPGGGKAFEVGDEQHAIPVAKSWVSVETPAAAGDQATPPRRFLSERTDWLSIKPKLDTLPKPRGHASLEKRKSRNALLAGLTPSATPARGSSAPVIASRTPLPSSSGLVIDFVVAAPQGLIAWWKGEGNALDAVSGFDGAVQGAMGYAAGKVGQGFSLDGNDDWVSVTNSALNFGPGADFSIEGWIKPITATTTYDVQMILDKRVTTIYDDGALGYALYLVGGRLGCQLADAPLQSYNYSAYGPAGIDLRADGNYHHVAMTIDRDNSTSGLKLYVDGAEVLSQAATHPGDLSNDGPLRIGEHATVFAPFKGIIDELSIYNRVLTPQEVQSIFAAGSDGKALPPAITTQPASQSAAVGANVTFSVVATGAAPLSYQWRLNSTNICGATTSAYTRNNVQPNQSGTYSVVISNPGGSTTSVDAILTVSGNAVSPAPFPSGLVSWWRAECDATDAAGINPGTLMNGAGFGAGEVGQGFSLNGASRYVRVSSSDSLRLAQELTIECWYKDTGSSWYYGLLAKRQSASPYATTYGINICPNQVVQLYFLDPSYGSWQVCGYSSVPAPNVFHHIAGTLKQIDSSHVELKLYIDGACVNTVTRQGNLANCQNTAPVTIGSSTENTEYLVGVIDEVAIFNRALSSAEIQAIFNAGASGKNPTPVITSQPVNQFVNEGASATFEVVATSVLPLSYQWIHDGVPLPGATSSRYVLNGVTSGAAGTYVVTVRNSAASVTSSSAQLAVLLSIPSQSITYRASAEFAATVVGTQPTAYQWRKNGTAIPNATASSFTVARPAVYRPPDTYDVLVQHPYGSLQSAPATLTVNPALLTVRANDQTREYGLENPALTYSITGFAPGEDQSSLSGTATAATTANLYSPVLGSPYPITISGDLASPNYSFTYVGGTLSIRRAHLIGTAQDLRWYQDGAPAFASTISGIRNGDPIAVEYFTTATASSPPGEYPIILNWLSTGGNICDLLQNYTETRINGTLTIPAGDSDRDGLPDSWEIEKFSNLSHDGTADADYDGRNDYQEFLDGTDPNDPASAREVILGHWTFDGEIQNGQSAPAGGFLPMAAIPPSQFVDGWKGQGWLVNDMQSTPAIIPQSSDSTAKLNLRSGSVRFWFKPLWTSGQGPGHRAVLLSVSQSPSWSLEANDTGTQLIFKTPSTTNSRPVNWTAGNWYQLAVSYGGDLDPAGLLGNWRLNEVSGSTATDDSGGNHTGTLLGGMTWTNGVAGGSLRFDGVDDYVSVPDAPELRLSAAMTIAFWMKKDAEATEWVRLVGKGDSTYRNFGVWDECGGDNRILFQVYGTSGVNVNFDSTVGVPLGQWHHIACTYDGTTGRIYIDGVPAGTQTLSITPRTSTAPVTFGYAPSMHSHLPGSLDEIRIYSRALTASEITALAQATPNVVALYCNGTLLQTAGPGSTNYPTPDINAQFCLGNNFDNSGANNCPANGVFDELETLNFPLSGSSISLSYTKDTSPPDYMSCDIYPIGLSLAGLNSQSPFTLQDTGVNGQFGWLDWDGGNSSDRDLAADLTPPSKVARYNNPEHYGDHTLAIGKSVSGVNGMKVGDKVRDAIDQLKAQRIPMVVPVWDVSENKINGSPGKFHITRFVAVKIIGSDFTGKTKTITFQCLGEANCGGGGCTQPPVMQFHNTCLNYVEGQGPQILDPNFTVTDDCPNFEGGNLAVDWSPTGQGLPEDQLDISPSGPFTIDASQNVIYQGHIIGARSGGQNGAPLLFRDLTADATPSCIAALMQNITYFNSSENPSTQVRQARALLNDGHGGRSDPTTMCVSFLPANNPPTLTRVDTLTGAVQGSPFSITYQMLAAAADEADVDSSPVWFRIIDVTSGTLTKNGVPVTANTALGPSDSDEIVWTPPAGQSGNQLPAFRIVAYDGALPSATPVQVSVNVAPLNVNAGPDATVWFANPTSYALSGNPTTAPVGSTLQWSVASGQGPVNFTSPTIGNASATFALPGIYVLRLTLVTGGKSISDDVVVNVKENKAPVVDVGPERILYTGYSPFLITGTAKDDWTAADQLDFQWSLASSPPNGSPFPEPLRHGPGLQILSSLPLGEYDFKLTVTDADGVSGEANLKVYVCDSSVGRSRTWTRDADFEEGYMMHVNYDSTPDSLVLSEKGASSRLSAFFSESVSEK